MHPHVFQETYGTYRQCRLDTNLIIVKSIKINQDFINS